MSPEVIRYGGAIVIGVLTAHFIKPRALSLVSCLLLVLVWSLIVSAVLR